MNSDTTIDPRVLEKTGWPEPDLDTFEPVREYLTNEDPDEAGNDGAEGQGSGPIYDPQASHNATTSFAQLLQTLEENAGFPNWPHRDEGPWDPVHTTRTVFREPSRVQDAISLPLQSPTAFENLAGAQRHSNTFSCELGAGPWVNNPTWTQNNDYSVLDEIALWSGGNDLPLLQQVGSAQTIDEFANLFYKSDDIQGLNSPFTLSRSSHPSSQETFSVSNFRPLQSFSFHQGDGSQTGACYTTDVGAERLQNYGGTANLPEPDPGMIAWPGYASQLVSSRPGALVQDGLNSEMQIYNSLRSSTGHVDCVTGLIHQLVDEQQVSGITEAVSQDVSHIVGANLNRRHDSSPANMRLDSDALATKSRIECELGAPGLNSHSASMVDSRANSYLFPTFSTAAPLPIIIESIQGGPSNMSSSLKLPGQRSGPLPKAKAEAIAKKRKARNVCIRCKQTKVSCTGGMPCARCSAISKAKVWDQPCIKAYFLEIVQGGTCNYISQRTINHLTLDGRRRVTMLLPEAFELNELLSSIQNRKDKFNIRARYRDDPLYTLDLGKCCDFLARLGERIGGQTETGLRNFIDHLLSSVNISGWQDCVTDCASTTDVLAVLFRWNTQPSRASFDMVPLDGASAVIPMDIENSNHGPEIIIAAQLARIFCRVVEIQAYKKLQQVLNEQRSLEALDQTNHPLVHLGRILLMMRWQISWRKVMLGNRNTEDNMSSQLKTSKIEIPTRFIYRMDELIKVLYFYFSNARRKLPSFVSTTILDGLWSTYADAEPIFENFPSSNSVEGFESWMEEGKAVIWITTNSQTQSVR